MRHRRLISAPFFLLASVAAIVPSILFAPSAGAVCVDDPNALMIRQMIEQGTTGSSRFDVLFLGRVRSLRQLHRDAYMAAKFRVRVHPVGFAPRGARVRFWNPGPGVGVSDGFVFERGQRYAVVAHRREGRRLFRFDGPCGQTSKLSRAKMWRLVHLFRHGA